MYACICGYIHLEVVMGFGGRGLNLSERDSSAASEGEAWPPQCEGQDHSLHSPLAGQSQTPVE